MKEINYKEMRFNPFNLIGGEWMPYGGDIPSPITLHQGVRGQGGLLLSLCHG